MTEARAATASAAFVLANTRPHAPPLTPEIILHLADEAVPLWLRTEEELAAEGLPPPFWAFAWAGGQALARHLLDTPDLVRGRRVLDLGSGSGLVAIAAMKAGAREVTACEIDPFACAAIAVNADLNGVRVTVEPRDVLGGEHPVPAEVVLVGDLFYERDLARRVLAFLATRRAAGAEVLVGDPGRSYLPKERLVMAADYAVPVTRELEDADIKRTRVWRLGP